MWAARPRLPTEWPQKEAIHSRLCSCSTSINEMAFGISRSCLDQVDTRQ